MSTVGVFQSTNGKMIMNCNAKNLKVAVTYLKMLFWQLPGKKEENLRITGSWNKI
jgi:hypothetical protein